MSVTPWWATAFAEHYQTLYAHRTDAAAETEVAGILAQIGTAGPVLDACCGNGRHLQALRRAGVPAVGFDWSRDLLQTAAERSDCAGRIARGDVRQPPFTGPFHAVLLFFTAFGYFDDAGNAAVLGRLAHLIRDDGWLMLDQPAPAVVRSTLVPHSERQVGELQLIEDRRLTDTRVEKDVRIINASGDEHSYTESVRLYNGDDISQLASEHGLELVDTWPSLLGPDQDQHRCVFWLRRSAR